MGEHPADPAKQPCNVGRGLQVADMVLCRRCLLELCRRRTVRFLHQPASCSVLHAGTEYYASPRPHSSVWSIRNAWSGIDAFLSAGITAGKSLERQVSLRRLLVHQHWLVADGVAEPVAGRSDAGVGFSKIRDLV